MTWLDVENMDPKDWFYPLEEYGKAIHLYLTADHEWWLAYDPEGRYPGDIKGPYHEWTHYPSGGWDHDCVPKWLLQHHLEMLHQDGNPGERSDIRRAKHVSLSEAPESVQLKIGGL